MSVPWALNVAVVATVLALTYLGGRRSRSFVPYGLTGVVLGAWLCATTLLDIAGWSTIVVSATTIPLFVIGTLRPGVKERPWHLAALAVGLSGWALCAGLAVVGSITEGRADISKRELLIVTLMAAVGGMTLFFWAFKLVAARLRKRSKTEREQPTDDSVRVRELDEDEDHIFDEPPADLNHPPALTVVHDEPKKEA